MRYIRKKYVIGFIMLPLIFNMLWVTTEAKAITPSQVEVPEQKKLPDINKPPEKVVPPQNGKDKPGKPVPKGIENRDEIIEEIKLIFDKRNKAIVNGDLELIKSIFDTHTKYGRWAYEYEQSKVKYIRNWGEKQGVKFVEIVPTLVVKGLKGSNEKISAYILCSTEYKYVYENETNKVNSSRIGTYHSLQMAKQEGKWIITKEWYKDPFSDSLDLENIKADEVKEYILAQPERDLSTIKDRRKSAMEYALKYCGAATEEKYGFKYNKKYRDYNPAGGDCANFASQILHEGGKFRKNSAWCYDADGGTRAWLNADGFKNYMVGSGRASVIAYGSYEKVYKASYKLLPGDFVAYEIKGDITHISTVTGADSRGYSLVTCHNSDRNNVPWDLGWSNKKVKYWLVRVHY